jgi:hypothetical protein
MRKPAIPFLASAICAAVLMAAVAPAQARTQHHRHWRHHAGGPWYGYSYPAQPMTRSYSQSGSSWVCPGIGRSFDCKIWPPPYEDDPDRRTSKF